MINKLLLIALTLLSSTALFAQTTVKGTVNDASLGGGLPGANIKVARKAVGTTTDFDGKFTLQVTDKPPFTLVISSLGYQPQTIEIIKNNQEIEIALTENATALDEVVVSASRTPERVIESPVTIERLDSRAIRNTTSVSFYDGLENLKGVDINAGGLTFKTVNTRGFATFGNERFVQLVDGMDNASPALNFAVGNLLGMSELDVKSVEILPGAASALYGANAFNGIMIMESKSPFDDQGISFAFKTGLTSQEAAGDHAFYDTTIRMAHAFNDKFAAKATLSYLKGEEWWATDYRNTTDIGGTYIPGTRASDPNYDGANVYGDEVSRNMRDIAKALISLGRIPASAEPFIDSHIPDINITRDGYNEVDLMNYEAKSVKFGASLNYRPLGDDRLELIWNSKYGTGNTIYQGINRYSLVNFFMEQHKLEVKGKNFFVRGYYASEDAGDSYDTRFAAINILNEAKDYPTWFGEYVGTYFSGVTQNGLTNQQAHNLARQTANTNGYPVPGTTEFKTLFDKVTSDPNVITGAQLKDNTNYYHADGNLNLRDYIDWAEIQVGGSYREYNLNSFGTIYTDADGSISYEEYGIYTQLQKKLMDDRLKFTGSIRYDKSQNFEGNFSPRVSLAYALGETKNHNFRVSYQTAFRNPTTQDQYIGLATGDTFLLGTAPENPARFSRQVDGFTITGSDALNRGYSPISIENGTPEKISTNFVKPEKVTAFEAGYRAALPIGNSKISIDLNGYYNMYSDFIATKDVIVLNNPADETLPAQAFLTALENNSSTFNLKTNSTADVDSYGVGVSLNTKILNGFNVGLNYTWSKFDFDQASDPDFEAGFNTPEHKVKFQFGHPNVFENFGFNVNVRWQDEFYWESTFLDGIVADRTVLDAQINYKVPSIKSVFKLGGTNLTGQEYLSAPGIGAIGSQYFISWTINN